MERARSGGPRGPGPVYLGLTVALLVLVSTVAYTARQAAPPTVAEFAPEALEQIKEAPQEQSSEFGSSDGGAGGGEAATSTTTAAAEAPTTTTALPVEVPRVNRCVGEPPRQIEDPQSPPCVAFWEGDNGGATWRGVTATEIHVVVPTANDGSRELHDLLEKYFNARFEFYGRKLVFHYGRDNIGSADPAEQKAHARDDFQRFQPFAATNYKSAQGFWYREEMLRQEVLFASTTGVYDEESPYGYTYVAPAREVFAGLGEWACARLAHRPAVHAGDADLRLQDRVFGVIMVTSQEDDTHFGPLVDELGRCDATPALTSYNEIAAGGVDPATATAVIARMRDAGVTSIFCLCHLFNYGEVQNAASAQLYHPEWLTSTYGSADLDGFIKLGGNPPDQMANAFGLTFTPRQIPLADEPFYRAAREVDPSYTVADESAFVFASYEVYRPLLLLASGIQMAGPNLTPETFREGLARARFPNPPHYTMPGAVGFAGGRQGMTLDAAEFWWSNTARSPYSGDGAGTFCYVDDGVRHRRGEWPADDRDPFFQPDTACDPSPG